MRLFNSLGSNYDRATIRRALWRRSRAGDLTGLTALLTKYYGGQAALVYKGREALVLALAAAELPADATVAITGFTCYAVYKAVATAGFAPHYLDIDPNTLNFTAGTLEAVLKANPKIRAVVIQNTLGYPAEIEPIERLCRQHDLVLIEDLAHSAGAHYGDGREVGTVGDLIMLSFGRDKIIDAVSGGALVIRNPKYRSSAAPLTPPPPSARWRDRLYPLLTALVRATYRIGLGPVLHQAFKITGLLSRAVDAEFYDGHSLPGWQAGLAHRRYNELATNLAHRGQIAQIYRQRLDPGLLVAGAVSQIDHATNLRFPILVQDRAELIKDLAGRGLYVGDIWYDAAIAPSRYSAQTDYRGQCPAAETVASQILNLPTHRGVTPASAQQLTEWINQWHQSR